jgi:hypothetical protein
VDPIALGMSLQEAHSLLHAASGSSSQAGPTLDDPPASSSSSQQGASGSGVAAEAEPAAAGPSAASSSSLPQQQPGGPSDPQADAAAALYREKGKAKMYEPWQQQVQPPGGKAATATEVWQQQQPPDMTGTLQSGALYHQLLKDVEPMLARHSPPHSPTASAAALHEKASMNAAAAASAGAASLHYLATASGAAAALPPLILAAGKAGPSGSSSGGKPVQAVDVLPLTSGSSSGVLRSPSALAHGFLAPLCQPTFKGGGSRVLWHAQLRIP